MITHKNSFQPCLAIEGLSNEYLDDQEYSLDVDLNAQFQQFHAKNPQVLDEVVRLARERLALGRKRISMKLLFELIREDGRINTDGKPYKLSNSYSGFYVRAVGQLAPDVAHLFETRAMRHSFRELSSTFGLLDEDPVDVGRA